MIGRGGQSSVFRGAHAVFGEVAIKIFHVDTEQAQHHFKKERDALELLDQIDGIVRVYRDGKNEDGEPYLVTQYMAGGSLQDKLEDHGPMQWQTATRRIIEASRAIDLAHRTGIVHADLKPANILLDAYGKAHIADFGISKLVDADATSSRILYTPHYAAPEVYENKGGTAAADIYSLAASLAALIVGRPPFDSGDANTPAAIMNRIINDPPPRLSRFGAPVRLSGVVRKAMSKQPSDRHRTAAEFADALDSCLHDIGTGTIVEPAIEPEEKKPAEPSQDDLIKGNKRRQGLPLLLGLALALVATGGTGVWYWFGRPEPELGPQDLTFTPADLGEYSSLAEAAELLPDGSTITLERGVYNVEETIRVTGTLTLNGAGPEETRLVAQGNRTLLEVLDGDLKLSDVGATAQLSSAEFDLVTIRASSVQISNAQIRLASDAGLVIEGSTGLIKGLTVADNKGNGLVVSGNSTVDLESVTAIDNGESGIVYTDEASGRVTGATAENNSKEGFLISAEASPTLLRNVATNNTESGFAWFDSATGTARNNTAAGNGGYGFIGLGTSDATLMDNTASENTKSGFAWREESTNTAKGNTSNGNNHGFVVREEARADLEKNNASANRDSGFLWVGVVKGSASENVSAENASDGFTFDGVFSFESFDSNVSENNGRHGYFLTQVGDGSLVLNTAKGNAADGFAFAAMPRGMEIGGNRATDNSGFGFGTPEPLPSLKEDNRSLRNMLGDWNWEPFPVEEG